MAIPTLGSEDQKQISRRTVTTPIKHMSTVEYAVVMVPCSSRMIRKSGRVLIWQVKRLGGILDNDRMDISKRQVTMKEKKKECVMYRDGKKICKSGFRQHEFSICGGYVSGNDKADTPNCCKELLPWVFRD